jgi:hypothetical protein
MWLRCAAAQRTYKRAHTTALSHMPHAYSATCPDDTLLPSGAQCRVSRGACDIAEYCTGTTALCPPDVLRGPTDQCNQANSNVCILVRTTHTACACVIALSAGVVLQRHISHLPCECVCAHRHAVRHDRTLVVVVQWCDHVACINALCVGAQRCHRTSCVRTAAGVCVTMQFQCVTAGDCAGGAACASAQCINHTCDYSTPLPSGSVCRPARSVCDLDETCTGNTTMCPPDAFAGKIVCRAANGTCDVAEVCACVRVCACVVCRV